MDRGGCGGNDAVDGRRVVRRIAPTNKTGRIRSGFRCRSIRELPVEKRDEIVKDLKAKLGEREVLVKVSKDVGLTRKWHLASDEEGARELGQRLFVKVGEAEPRRQVPSINIGVTGKKKEQAVSGEIVMRLMDDVWKILGIKPPAKPEP